MMIYSLLLILSTDDLHLGDHIYKEARGGVQPTLTWRIGHIIHEQRVKVPFNHRPGSPPSWTRKHYCLRSQSEGDTACHNSLSLSEPTWLAARLLLR